MAGGADDTALMMRYGEGDMSAFEQLYSRHRAPLFRYLKRQLPDGDLADDLFQEVWSRIIKSRHNYRPTAKFTTYMYRIAKNCVIDESRRSGRTPPMVTTDDEPTVEPVATDNDPVQAAETGDARALLERALMALPPEQREAFLLHEEAGLNLGEIGEITSVTRETVKSRLRYAMRKLRSSLPREELAREIGIAHA